MIRLALPLFAAGLAVLLLLAVPADPARAHNNNSAALHAETYPLHEAAFQGDLDSVNHFLNAHRADVHQETQFTEGFYQDGQTPLHYAARNGSASVIPALVAAGADVNAKGGRDGTDRTPQGHTPLHYAADGGHAAAVSVLLAEGADPNVKAKGGGTPLHEVFTDSGSAAVVAALLAGGASVNVKNDVGAAPLHVAALGYSNHGEEDKVLRVSLLIDAGADVNAKNNNGRTPLYNSNAGSPIRALLLAAGAHWGEPCPDGAAVNPARSSPPCVCEAAFYSTEKSACVPYAPCLGGTLDAGANTCECPDGLATLGDGVCEYKAAACETLGGEVEGEDDRVCSGIDWNDTFCLMGSDSAFPCAGLFYHVWRCNDGHNRPALDPWHCAKKCEFWQRARGAGCAIIN